MKRFDMKGVSPVIATILLIALTVAAVGIVAVILSTIGTPTPAPVVTFGTPDTYVGPAQSDNTDYSTVIDLPLSSGTLSMMDLKVYITCYVNNYLGSGQNVTVTYAAQMGNDGVKSVCTVSPPAPAQGVPPASVQGVYVQYWGTPVRTAGDKVSFFFKSDNTAGMPRMLPSVTGGTVIVKLVHVPSSTTIYQDTLMTRAKVW